MYLKFLTGKTRFRPQICDESVLLVLQVEEKFDSSPVSGWRDAKLEDLRGKEVEVRQ